MRGLTPEGPLQKSASHLGEPTRTPRPAAHEHDTLGGRAGCAGGSVNLNGTRSSRLRKKGLAETSFS